MMALFEVLSFKGWLDVRDVLIKALGPVSRYLFKIYNRILFFVFFNILYLVCILFSASCNLHTHLYFPWLHDRLDIVRGCRDCELLRK